MVKKEASEVTELIKRSVSSKYVEDDGALVINRKYIGDNRADLSLIRLTSKEKKITKEKFLNEEDILINSTGTGVLGRTAQTDNINESITVGTHITIMRPSEDVNAKFLGYFIRLNESLITSMGKGATSQIKLLAADLANIEIYPPGKSTQDKIVKILSVYDNLIRNNLKRTKLLKEGAELLYREWSINSRSPGYEEYGFLNRVPNGWKKKKVGELVLKFKRESKVKKEDHLEASEIPVIDQSKNLVGGYTDNEDAREESVPTIISGDRTRIVKYVDFPFASDVDEIQLTYSNPTGVSQQYFYWAIKSIDLFSYSYTKHLKYLKDEEICTPSKAIMEKFSEIVGYSFKQITNLRNQSNRLTEVRDILLLELIIGGIEVWVESIRRMS